LVRLFLFMYYVYIIYSASTGKYYKGYTTSPEKRLEQHNSGESRYTRHFVPWVLVYVEIFDEKTEALKREISIKKYSKSQVEDLIAGSKNQISKI
jgi:putative endonuclease